MTFLTHLSPDVLNIITAFDGMGICVLKLWQTGDLGLIFLLRYGGCRRLRLTDSRLVFQDTLTIKCPMMVQSLNQLQSLELVCSLNLDTDFIPFLPPCLEQLIIVCDNHKTVRYNVCTHRPQLEKTIRQPLLKGVRRFHGTINNMLMTISDDGKTLIDQYYDTVHHYHVVYTREADDENDAAPSFINDETKKQLPHGHPDRARRLTIFVPLKHDPDADYGQADPCDEPLAGGVGWRCVLTDWDDFSRQYGKWDVVPADNVTDGCTVSSRAQAILGTIMFDSLRANEKCTWFCDMQLSIKRHHLDDPTLTSAQGQRYVLAREIKKRYSFDEVSRLADEWTRKTGQTMSEYLTVSDCLFNHDTPPHQRRRCYHINL